MYKSGFHAFLDNCETTSSKNNGIFLDIRSRDRARSGVVNTDRFPSNRETSDFNEACETESMDSNFSMSNSVQTTKS